MRLPASKPFLKNNDDEVLWLGLVARNTGVPASRWLQIKDEVLALNFEKAVSLRLLYFDNERENENKKFLANTISMVMTGEKMIPDDDILDSEILANDPYSDKHTQVW